MPKRVAVLGVPSAAGAFTDSPTRSPQALREAGLIAALSARGHEVEDIGDIGPFHSAEDPDHPTCRNIPGVVEVMKATASAMASAGDGLVLVLGGDCSQLGGVLAGARTRAGGPVALAYLDAHGDLNTPQTTPSGRVCGMALAVALGHGARELVAAVGGPPLVEPARTVLLGFRELDPGERKLVENVGLALDAPTVWRGGPESMADLALRITSDLPLVVHFDVDIIDSREMATHLPTALGRGLPRVDVAVLLGRLLAAPRVVALAVSGFDRDSDPDGAHARALVEILVGAVGQAS